MQARVAIQHVFSIDVKRMNLWFSSSNNVAASRQEVAATTAPSSVPGAKRRGRPPNKTTNDTVVSAPPSSAPDALSSGSIPDRSVGGRGGQRDGPAAHIVQIEARALSGIVDSLTPESLEKEGEAATAGARRGTPEPAPAAQLKTESADAEDESDMIVMKVHRSHLPSIWAVLQSFYPPSTQAAASKRSAQPPALLEQIEPLGEEAICSNTDDMSYREPALMETGSAGEPEPLPRLVEDQLRYRASLMRMLSDPLMTVGVFPR